MFIDNPMIVMRFGAIQEGTLPTSHSQYPCIKGSSRDRPALWYLCSSSRLSWCLDSGGVGNWNNLFNTHPGVLMCPKPRGDSGWESPHRFLADRCPLMDLGFLLFGKNNLSSFRAFCGWSVPFFLGSWSLLPLPSESRLLVPRPAKLRLSHLFLAAGKA